MQKRYNSKQELNYFLPLKIHLSMKGGFEMEFKIVKKPAFTVIGCSKTIKNEEGYKECPQFWTDHFEKEKESIFVEYTEFAWRMGT